MSLTVVVATSATTTASTTAVADTDSVIDCQWAKKRAITLQSLHLQRHDCAPATTRAMVFSAFFGECRWERGWAAPHVGGDGSPASSTFALSCRRRFPLGGVSYDRAVTYCTPCISVHGR